MREYQQLSLKMGKACGCLSESIQTKDNFKVDCELYEMANFL